MIDIAYRGDGLGRPTTLRLPPQSAALVHGGRLRKSWRYVGVWSPTLSLCAARVLVGPIAQEFWAVWDRPAGTLTERTRFVPTHVRSTDDRLDVSDRGVRIAAELAPEPASAVEVVTPVADGWTWTRKRLAHVEGSVALPYRSVPLDGVALIDESAGYHPRRTHWWWSAGTARLGDGRRAAWNLVVGINDRAPHGENTLWLDGVPTALGEVTFEDDLAGVRFGDGTGLEFRAEAERASATDLLVVSSTYRQPFGTFRGTLPGGLVVDEGYGVMEDHRAVW